MKKKFFIKDFIYNNGIVNFAEFLENKEKSFILTSNFLEVDVEDDEFYGFLATFLKENNIVFQTENYRWFFDEKNTKFVKDKKFDTLGGSSNDLRNGIYLYKKIDEFGLSRDEVERMYLEFCEKEGLKPEYDGNKLKVPNRNNEVVIYITLDEAIKRFAKYLAKSDILKFDSKIHSFEDGSTFYHDMLKIPKDYKIDKWDALIYWFGSRVKRWFYADIFIYPNASNLIYLKEFKDYLTISDSKVKILNKDNLTVELPTNIDIVAKLKDIGINIKYFYISKSEEEVFLKLLIYLFLYFYIVEIKTSVSHPLLKEKFSKLLEMLMYVSFVIYKDDGDFKAAFFEYSRGFKVFEFLFELMEKGIFEKFINIIVVVGDSLLDKDGIYIKKFASKFLNFQNLRKIYVSISYLILKNIEKVKIRLDIYEFEKMYLEFIKGENMQIHNDAKILGEWIGYVSAQLDDKDLLFKLRNIKNYKQLLSFFKDFKYVLLKEEKVGVAKEFDEALERVLNNIEKVWDIIKDYMAIYAINKYKAVKFAKEKGE